MQAKEARDLLMRFYSRDREPLLERFAPDYVCHTPGDCAVSGHHVGRSGMEEHIERMQRLTNRTFRPRHLGAFVTDGEWALVPVQLDGEREGRTLDQPAFGVWRFSADGAVLSHWELPTDLAAFERFWGPAPR